MKIQPKLSLSMANRICYTSVLIFKGENPMKLATKCNETDGPEDVVDWDEDADF